MVMTAFSLVFSICRVQIRPFKTFRGHAHERHTAFQEEIKGTAF
jgi:hypothetical protein